MAYLNVFTPAISTRGPVLDWPFANELWNVTMDAFGSNPNPEKDPSSTSLSRFDEAIVQPRILIVEDSKTDVFLIREAIDKCKINADIDVLRDGQAATEYFDAADADERAPCPDLILLDLNLPKASGDEVLKHLRASRRCQYATVVIVSSSDAPSDRTAVESCAVAAYFKKPSIYAEFMKLGPLVRDLLAASRGPQGTEDPS